MYSQQFLVPPLPSGPGEGGIKVYFLSMTDQSATVGRYRYRSCVASVTKIKFRFRMKAPNKRGYLRDKPTNKQFNVAANNTQSSVYCRDYLGSYDRAALPRRCHSTAHRCAVTSRRCRVDRQRWQPTRLNPRRSSFRSFRPRAVSAPFCSAPIAKTWRTSVGVSSWPSRILLFEGTLGHAKYGYPVTSRKSAVRLVPRKV